MCEARDRVVGESGEHRVDREAETAPRVAATERLEMREHPAVDGARGQRPQQLDW